MNQKFNLKFSSLVLVCFLTLLTGCSKDEFENAIIHSHNNDISFEQFKKETGLVNFETTFKIKKDRNALSARNADGSYELSDFIIDTEIIKKLDLNEKVTYTFRVFPFELASEKSIYNLTLHKVGGNWETSVVEFIPTDANYQMISNGLTEQVQGKMKLLYESSVINAQTLVNCWTVQVVNYHCPYPAGGCNGPGGSCDALIRFCSHCATYQSLTFCNTDEFGNSNGGYDIGTPVSNPFGNTGHYPGGGPDGTGTGVSPNNPEEGEGHSFTPNLESPNVNLNPTNIDPCNQLNTLKSKPNFVSRMNTLKNSIGGTKEKGFILRDINNNECSAVSEGDNYGSVIYPYETQTTEELYRTYGTAHNHLENEGTQIGIFTLEDLANLLLNGMIETSPDNPYHTITPTKAIAFVITSKGFFALKITDLNKLKTFVQDYGTWSFDKTQSYLTDTFQNPEVYNIMPTSTHDQQVTGFLRFMQDKDLGIELFEVNKDTFDNWKKLSLVPNGNGNYSFSSQPCN